MKLCNALSSSALSEERWSYGKATKSPKTISMNAKRKANEHMLVKMLEDFVKLQHRNARLLSYPDQGRWLLVLGNDNFFVLFYTRRDDDDDHTAHMRTSFPLSHSPSEKCVKDTNEAAFDRIRLAWNEKKQTCLVLQELNMNLIQGERDFHEQIYTFALVSKRLSERAETFWAPLWSKLAPLELSTGIQIATRITTH